MYKNNECVVATHGYCEFISRFPVTKMFLLVILLVYNRQNYRNWSSENSLHQQPLHSPKVTVWCAMSSLGIIGLFFLKDEKECDITVTVVRYADMMNQFDTTN